MCSNGSRKRAGNTLVPITTLMSPILLLLLSGKIALCANLACWEWGIINKNYALSDLDSCVVNQINVAFNGKLDECGVSNGVPYADARSDCDRTVYSINNDHRYGGPEIACKSYVYIAGGKCASLRKLARNVQATCTQILYLRRYMIQRILLLFIRYDIYI